MNGALKRDIIGCVWAYHDQNKGSLIENYKKQRNIILIHVYTC